MDLIARTNENIVYDGPAFVLLDFDTKGMPASVGEPNWRGSAASGRRC